MEKFIRREYACYNYINIVNKYFACSKKKKNYTVGHYCDLNYFYKYSVLVLWRENEKLCEIFEIV